MNSSEIVADPAPELPAQFPAGHRGRGLLMNWLPALIGLGVLACESTEAFTASNTSSWLRPIWQGVFGMVSDVRWETIHHLIRKSGHFTGYGTESLLFLLGWLRTLRRSAGEALLRFRLHAAALAILCTFLTASADEFHQTFLPGRTGVFSDVLLDTAGAIAAQLLWMLVYRPRD